MDTGGPLSANNNTGDKWSSEKIVEFLEEYRSHPCLWDSRHRLYKSKGDRLAAETDILKKLKLPNLDINIFRSKVRNIRNTYRQEVMKVVKISKGGEGVFVPRLRWFNLADSFLRKTLEGNYEMLPMPQRCQEEVSSEPDVQVDDSSALEFDEDVKPNVDDLRHLDPASWAPSGGQTNATKNQAPAATSDVSGGSQKRPCPWDVAAVASNAQTTAQRLASASPIGRSVPECQFAAAAAESPRPSVEVRRAGSSGEFDAFGRYVSLQLQQLPLDVAVELEMEIVNLVCRKRLALLREELIASGGAGDQNPF